jgi:hypothetical protein
MIELRRMTKTDLINFNASGFQDGCLPLIGEFRVDAETVTVIYDCWGLSLIRENGQQVRLVHDELNIIFQLESRMTEESVQEILSNYCTSLLL